MTTSNPPVRIGIVGGGMMSQVGHLPFYLEDSRCVVVRVAESRPSLMRALGERLGDDRMIDDHGPILADREIDMVVISAPRPATGPLTAKALQAGKHVLAEKPMAHTVEQAGRLVAAAEAAGVVYGIGYMKRFDPGIEAAKRTFDSLTDSARLGRLLMARFYNFSKSYAVPVPAHTRPEESRQTRFESWPLWPEWLPAGHRDAYAWFMNSASHDVNLLRLFFPTAEAVTAAVPAGDGAIVATLRAGDVPLQLEIAKAETGGWREGAEFLFENGRLALAVPSPMDTVGVSRVVLDDRAVGEQVLESGSGWSFARQASGFLDAVLGEGGFRNTGAECLADLRLIEAIWRQVAG